MATRSESGRPVRSAADLLTVNDAAEYAPALGERFLRRLIAERRIPVVRVGRRVFLSRHDLDRLAVVGREEAVR